MQHTFGRRRMCRTLRFQRPTCCLWAAAQHRHFESGGLSGMKELWLGKRLVVRIGDPIPAAGQTVEQMLEAGEKAVAGLVPPYVDPGGSKPLGRWLTGLF